MAFPRYFRTAIHQQGTAAVKCEETIDYYGYRSIKT